MNESPATVAPSIKDRTLAVRTVPQRKKPNGINGAFERDSMTTNAPSTSTEKASGSIVDREEMPSVAATVNAYTRSRSPPVTVKAPGRSKCPFTSRPAALGRNFCDAIAATIPIGTLMNMTDLQPNPTVRNPPATDPAAKPAESTAMKILSALFLSLPSGKSSMKTAKAVTEEMAAPIPCIALETTSDTSDGAKPPTIEAIVKRTIPEMNSFF